jgi:hypothetical protein
MYASIIGTQMYYFKKKTDNPVEFTNVTGKVNEGVE